MMPEMDGHAVIRALLAINPQLRIIAASGLNPGNREAGDVDPRVKHFLTKPFTAQTLLGTLRQVLASVPDAVAAAESAYSAANTCCNAVKSVSA